MYESFLYMDILKGFGDVSKEVFGLFQNMVTCGVYCCVNRHGGDVRAVAARQRSGERCGLVCGSLSSLS